MCIIGLFGVMILFIEYDLVDGCELCLFWFEVIGDGKSVLLIEIDECKFGIYCEVCYEIMLVELIVVICLYGVELFGENYGVVLFVCMFF